MRYFRLFSTCVFLVGAVIATILIHQSAAEQKLIRENGVVTTGTVEGATLRTGRYDREQYAVEVKYRTQEGAEYRQEFAVHDDFGAAVLRDGTLVLDPEQIKYPDSKRFVRNSKTPDRAVAVRYLLRSPLRATLETGAKAIPFENYVGYAMIVFAAWLLRGELRSLRDNA